MSPEEIRIELFKRRKTCSQSKIAKDVGVSRQAVCAVIDRKFISNRIMQAVADAVGRDKGYVFPEYFLQRANRP